MPIEKEIERTEEEMLDIIQNFKPKCILSQEMLLKLLSNMDIE